MQDLLQKGLDGRITGAETVVGALAQDCMASGKIQAQDEGMVPQEGEG